MVSIGETLALTSYLNNVGGQGSAGTVYTFTVPEPATVVPMIFAGLALLFCAPAGACSGMASRRTSRESSARRSVNCIGPEQPIMVHLDDPVAFARRGFQSLAVAYFDLAAAVFHETTRLQALQNDRDPRAAHAKHDRQQFVRQRQNVVLHAIVRNQ